MSKDDFVIEMLTLQFISGKTDDSAAEYVKLYRDAHEQISSAYADSKEEFDFSPLAR